MNYCDHSDLNIKYRNKNAPNSSKLENDLHLSSLKFSVDFIVYVVELEVHVYISY